MNIEQLKYFIAVAENLHLSNVASDMNISEPALSKKISRLEEELGYDLFERVGRNIKLSKCGELFLPYAKKSVSAIEEGITEMVKFTNLSERPVTIQGVPLIIFPGLVPFLFTKYPDLTLMAAIEVSNAKMEENLLTQMTDICITSADLHNSKLNKVSLLKEPIYLVVSEGHPLYKKDQITSDELTNETFILSSRYSGLTKAFNMIFEKKRVKPDTFKVSNINECLDYVALNRGVALIARSQYLDLMRRQTSGIKTLEVTDSDGRLFTNEYFMYTRKAHNNSEVYEVKGQLKKFFDNNNDN